MHQAVILARGLGTRMRKEDASAELAPEQAAAAASGVKAMIPIDRPFLDYVLHALAETGYERICLVIGPEHQIVRDYYERLAPRRLKIEFAVQVHPRGTADAVAAAETVTGSEPFIVLNSDNYYPLEALKSLRDADGSALAAFDRDAMLAGSNIPADRLLKFALVESDGNNSLKRVLEKPDEATVGRLPLPLAVSMNCWRFTPVIYDACRKIVPSPRGELEITDAVQYAIDCLHERFRMLWCHAPVLDLSSRNDIAPVAARLAGTVVNL
jgi:glucose-1-phosphate thymidylyltransferase